MGMDARDGARGEGGDKLKAPQPCAAPTAVMSAPRCRVDANSEGMTVERG